MVGMKIYDGAVVLVERSRRLACIIDHELVSIKQVRLGREGLACHFGSGNRGPPRGCSVDPVVAVAEYGYVLQMFRKADFCLPRV